MPCTQGLQCRTVLVSELAGLTEHVFVERAGDRVHYRLTASQMGHGFMTLFQSMSIPAASISMASF